MYLNISCFHFEWIIFFIKEYLLQKKSYFDINQLTRILRSKIVELKKW